MISIRSAWILGLLIITTCQETIGQNIDSLNVKTPKKAALWSILPGGGQIYNGKYLKAGIIIALESLAIWQSIENGQKFKDNNNDSFLRDRNKFAWWGLFMHLFGTIDAVVDSHLKPFDEMMNDKSFDENTIIKEAQPDGK